MKILENCKVFISTGMLNRFFRVCMVVFFLVIILVGLEFFLKIFFLIMIWYEKVFLWLGFKWGRFLYEIWKGLEILVIVRKSYNYK